MNNTSFIILVVVGVVLLLTLYFLIIHWISKYAEMQGMAYAACFLLCIFLSPIIMLLVAVIMEAVNKPRKNLNENGSNNLPSH